jgi:hypothetical protein
VTFTTTPPTSATVGATYSVAAVGGPSGQPVVLSVDATSSSVCALAQHTVTFGAAGTCVIDANQAGTAVYAPAPQAQQAMTVSSASAPIPQTVTFTTTPPVSATVGARYAVAAVGGPSGQPVVLSVDPTSTPVCSLGRRATVTFRAAGTCVIDANQAGTAVYAPAPQAQQVITVSAAPVGSAPTMTSPANDAVPAGQPFSFTVSANGDPTPTIAISGYLPRGVSVSGGANGTATISGTSWRSRTYSLSITATNGTGQTASQNFTLTFT